MQSSSHPPGHPGIADIIRPHRLYWGSSRGIVCGPPDCGWTPTSELFAHEEWCEHVAELIEAAGVTRG